MSNGRWIAIAVLVCAVLLTQIVRIAAVAPGDPRAAITDAAIGAGVLVIVAGILFVVVRVRTAGSVRRRRTLADKWIDVPSWAVEIAQASGTVAVHTTSVSVKFTVTSDDYFDVPGSTITFSTYQKGGQLFLRQTANSRGATLVSQVGIVAGGARSAWRIQFKRFKKLLRTYR